MKDYPNAGQFSSCIRKPYQMLMQLKNLALPPAEMPVLQDSAPKGTSR